MKKKKEYDVRNCDFCNDIFTPTAGRQRFCNPSCARDSWLEEHHTYYLNYQKQYRERSKEEERKEEDK